MKNILLALILFFASFMTDKLHGQQPCYVLVDCELGTCSEYAPPECGGGCYVCEPAGGGGFPL